MSSEITTFVGFGLGAIQSGLFLYEAQASGKFDRYVVAEVVPETVEKVRQNNGIITINIAHADRIETVNVGPIIVLNPQIEEDQEKLVTAMSSASMITTALPGVEFYDNSRDSKSVARLIAESLMLKVKHNGPKAVIYTAENNNIAAETLTEKVLDYIPVEEQGVVLQSTNFLNTVIGKMSGIISDPEKIEALNLSSMMPDLQKAILVEAFNKILISRIQFNGSEFEYRIPSFVEKADLLPFEEAKLYGHNATHSLGAYLAALFRLQYISEFRDIPGMMSFLRQAFLEESGAGLISKYNGMDPLFTREGYELYVDDLLERMVNPYLADQVDRVCRDVERKLGWSDRLIGTIRLGLDEGFLAKRYALGAAAALIHAQPSLINSSVDPADMLKSIWKKEKQTPHLNEVIGLIQSALEKIRQWKSTHPDEPEMLLKECDLIRSY